MKCFAACAQMGRRLGEVEICFSLSGYLYLHVLVSGTMENSSQGHGPLSIGSGVRVLCWWLVMWPRWVCLHPIPVEPSAVYGSQTILNGNFAVYPSHTPVSGGQCWSQKVEGTNGVPKNRSIQREVIRPNVEWCLAHSRATIALCEE